MKSAVSLPLAALALTVVGTIQTAAAQEADAVFQRHDRDGDGRVTARELPQAKTFALFDADRDGVITLAEYRQALKRRAGGRGGFGAPSARALTAAELEDLASGPEILKAGDAGIGRMVADLEFTDLAGKPQRLADWKSQKGIVLAMTSATCPVSKRYLPSLTKLEEELAGQGIALLLVNPFASETREEIEAQLAGHALAAPYIHDGEKRLAAALRAGTTTEVFLLDAARTLVYRGALDDQYGVHHSLDAPRRRFLADAIAAMLAGARPRIEATVAPGCEIDLVSAPAPAPELGASPVTYHRDIARILQANCVRCHRDGGSAPFSLEDAGEVMDRAKTIRRVVTEGAMPPWFAAPLAGSESSPWANDCSLSARDKADLLAWIDSPDRPMGDPADAPARRAFPEEWTIGTPDLVIPLSRAYDVKATGVMPYQFDVVETGLAEDRWVSAYEIRPSARDVVHHVIVQVHPPGDDVRDRDEGAGGFWAAYVPGNGGHAYRDGFARKLPAGARVSFQIHYTPSGKAVKERLRLGLVFATAPPRYEVRTLGLADRDLSIPPGAAAHEESLSRPVPFDIAVTGFMAHMHVRGKAFAFELAHADGRRETLLDIPRYDFNWQLRYELKEPRILPAGSTVTVRAVYDNSAGNQANPDPGKLVRWGNQTYDEMMIGYLDYFVPVEGGAVAEQQ